MNILFTRFPLESTYGGAEVQTLSLMKGLRERGHEVGFLGSCPILLREAVSYELRATSLSIGPPPVTKWGAVSFLWRQFGMRRKIIESMSPPHPNPLPPGEGRVICMLSLTEKLLLTDWAMQHDIKVFWIEHDRIGRWLRWNPWLPKLRRMSKFATTVVVSDLSRRLYEKLGWDPGRIAVIPNGIDVKRLGVTLSGQLSSIPRYTPRKTRGTRDDTAELAVSKGDSLHVGTITRLSREKGVDLLIEAIKDLPNVHLTIVGTGRDEDNLRRMIPVVNSRTQEHNNSITLLRSVPDVGSFYRSLDLFVLPSRDHDPCPLAPIEAMACGVPTIMTDVCGTAEYVENEKEAIVVPAGSSGALREAIVQLQNDADLRHRLAEHGPQVVAERFSMDRMVDQYEKLLMKI